MLIKKCKKTFNPFFHDTLISIPFFTMIIGIFIDHKLFLLFIGLIINLFINHGIKQFVSLFNNKLFIRPCIHHKTKCKGCGVGISELFKSLIDRNVGPKPDHLNPLVARGRTESES